MCVLDHTTDLTRMISVVWKNCRNHWKGFVTEAPVMFGSEATLTFLVTIGVRTI